MWSSSTKIYDGLHVTKNRLESISEVKTEQTLALTRPGQSSSTRLGIYLSNTNQGLF